MQYSYSYKTRSSRKRTSPSRLDREIDVRTTYGNLPVVVVVGFPASSSSEERALARGSSEPRAREQISLIKNEDITKCSVAGRRP